MTKLEALRRVLSTPRDHHHLGRIGRVQKWDKSDGREKLIHCVRVLRSVIRRVA